MTVLLDGSQLFTANAAKAALAAMAARSAQSSRGTAGPRPGAAGPTPRSRGTAAATCCGTRRGSRCSSTPA